ncbi:MAG: protein kinase [Clostridium sp.]|nr:protein kinase [Clostridium sp.]MCM1207303.1 protein kinase [Ruminococcus sp.]
MMQTEKKEQVTNVMDARAIDKTYVQNATQTGSYSSDAAEYLYMIGMDIKGVYGTYTITDIYSEGGEAILFLATAGENKYIVKYYVAVKRMSRDKREAFISLLYNQECRYIVPLVDYGEYNDKLFDVYSFFDGGNLAEHATELDLSFIVKTVIPNVNEALNVIHSKGIVHKDIKASNILISNDGSYVMLSDLGIMSLVEEQSGMGYTRNNFWTNGYAAPEVLGGTPTISSDYYSFGITLLSLINGGIDLFAGMDLPDIVMRTNGGRIPLLDRQKFVDKVFGTFTLKERIEGLICGLTIFDPNDRWGYKEIIEWCDGKREFPLIEKEERIEVDFSNPFYTRDGEKIYQLSELADYLASNWDYTKKDVMRKNISQWLASQRPDKSSLLDDLVEKEVVVVEDDIDCLFFKAIYLLDDHIPKIWWKGKSYKDFSSLASAVKDGKADVRSLLVKRVFSWFIKYNKSIHDNDDLSAVIRGLEDRAQSNSEMTQYLFVMHFLTAQTERTIKINNKEFHNVEQIVDYLCDLPSGLEVFCQELLNSNLFFAWMIFNGYEDHIKNATKDLAVLDNTDCERRVFVLLDAIASNNIKLRNYVIHRGDNAHIFWLKSHIDDYLYLNPYVLNLKNIFVSAQVDTVNTINEIITSLEKLEESYIEFDKALYNYPFQIATGIGRDDTLFSIVPKSSETAFMYVYNNIRVPAGFVHENNFQSLCSELYNETHLGAEREVNNIATSIRRSISKSEMDLNGLKNKFYSNNLLKGVVCFILAAIFIGIGIWLCTSINSMFFMAGGFVGSVCYVYRGFIELTNLHSSDIASQMSENLRSVSEQINAWQASSKITLERIFEYYRAVSCNPIVFDMNQFTYYQKYRLKAEKELIPNGLEQTTRKGEIPIDILSAIGLAVLELGIARRTFVDYLIEKYGVQYYSTEIYVVMVILMLAGMIANIIATDNKYNYISVTRYVIIPLFGVIGVVFALLLAVVVAFAIRAVETILGLLSGILIFVVIIVIIGVLLGGS